MNIIDTHGANHVIHTGEEWRTKVVNGVCVFMKNNACSIHSKSYYPAVCRGFPDSDGVGGQEGDLSICPELCNS